MSECVFYHRYNTNKLILFVLFIYRIKFYPTEYKAGELVLWLLYVLRVKTVAERFDGNPSVALRASKDKLVNILGIVFISGAYFIQTIIY